jgi:oxygen-independent coproporphyrinogen III oxidase
MTLAMPFPSDELLAKLDRPGPRYTSYPPVPAWRSDFGHAHLAAALGRAASTPDDPLSLYVHLPFCAEMCTYCGCNVVVTRDRTRHDRYLDVLAAELRQVGERLGGRRTLARLHLGGGTPTALDLEALARLHRLIAAELVLTPDAEQAVEIDPAVTSREQLALLRALGFTRLSFGVQDFDPKVQATVHRIQPFELTARTVADARALGYTSINVDLIYGLPYQHRQGWRDTLDRVLELGVDRVAAFSFAYVPTVKPHQRRLPQAALPSGRDKLELFRLTHDVLVGAGYVAIGMDHFARPHDELAVAQGERRLWRDFQGYTTLRASDTVAVGMSAISDVGGAFAQNHKRLSSWERAVAGGELPVERGLVLSADDQRRRRVIVALMCNFWVDLGTDAAAFAPELEALAPLVADGLVEVTGAEITVTPLGRMFVRNVAMVFDATTTDATYSRTV